MADVRRHLEFLKIQFLTVSSLRRPILHNRAKFHQDRSIHCWEMTIFSIFQDGGRPPSWICWSLIWTIYEEHLAVFITVQNLVVIGSVVSIIWKFQYFMHLAWKRLFTPSKLVFLGHLIPKIGSGVIAIPKRHFLGWKHVIGRIDR